MILYIVFMVEHWCCIFLILLTPLSYLLPVLSHSPDCFSVVGGLCQCVGSIWAPNPLLGRHTPCILNFSNFGEKKKTLRRCPLVLEVALAFMVILTHGVGMTELDGCLKKSESWNVIIFLLIFTVLLCVSVNRK